MCVFHVLVIWRRLTRPIGLPVHRLGNDVTRVCGNQDYVTDTIFPSHLWGLDTNSACSTCFSCWLSGNLNSFKDIMRPTIPQAELGHRSERRVAARGGGRERQNIFLLHGSGYLVIKSCERQCPFNANERGRSLPFGTIILHRNRTGLTVSAFKIALVFLCVCFFWQKLVFLQHQLWSDSIT